MGRSSRLPRIGNGLGPGGYGLEDLPANHCFARTRTEIAARAIAILVVDMVAVSLERELVLPGGVSVDRTSSLYVMLYVRSRAYGLFGVVPAHSLLLSPLRRQMKTSPEYGAETDIEHSGHASEAHQTAV